MSYDCPRCLQKMVKHRTLDVWRCANVNCGLFDVAHSIKRAARVAPEHADLPAALPPAPSSGSRKETA